MESPTNASPRGPYAYNSDSDADVNDLIGTIQRAKAAETAGLTKRRRSLSLSSRSKTGRTLSSSENPGALGLPDASFERNADGSPRLESIPTPEPLPLNLKASKKKDKDKNKNKDKDAPKLVAPVVPVLPIEAPVGAQLRAMREQLTAMARNMDTLYTITTKQLERIYNLSDDIHRRVHGSHMDDQLRLVSDDGDRREAGTCASCLIM